MNLESSLTIIICTILVYSSIAKIAGYRDFAKTIHQLNYPSFLAWGVIAVELAVAFLLLFDATHFIGEIGALILFCAFYGAAGTASWKKMKVVCNCFGKSTEEELGWATIMKITPLFIASIICISLQSLNADIWRRTA
ncbi:MauE/DoxX family redox-associated membrane protein [Paenibacillus thiaminolyticus]|uniref:MauE/DoxX family redox-associated membrane protein n=1 Tax=Paenibacillus thiaminolyticus TaxID=49283 RepID=UPI003D26912E